ncbi:MAG: glycosyl hydrolase 53 family protein [Lachnospiraceae bacterium]|nr:glycosyl hydrolase 53 family protein [Lachnospiraceae bacterium]
MKTGMKAGMKLREKTKIMKIPAIIGLCIILAGNLAGCGQNMTEGMQPTDTESLESNENKAEESADAEAPADEAGPDSEKTVVEQTYFPKMPTGEEQSSIYVQKIDGLSEDFIRGMDISSLLVEENCGVKYYDAEGNEQDLFKILADAGVNTIRVRVWNYPFDAEANGYGGGNCTAGTAAELGARAAAYGMNTCVDFHYSDFWADPNKQMCPKSWEGMNLSEKKQALYDYTVESLRTIMGSGAHVTMVQTGNEINHGMAGVTAFGDVAELLKSGSEAVRAVSEEFGTDIKVTVHYTSVDDSEGVKGIAEKLSKYKVDYDVFGISYYPYWHGTMTNMVNVLKHISETYGVETCIMETSYMYTDEDGDGSGNSVSGPDALDEYPIGVQGQASLVRDVFAAANEAGALGVFYWEGAWIPVNPESGTREAMWEEYGSGWASSYAAEYDPKDAGAYYGGCSWENQAFFDFEGNVLDSINVFKYVYYGAKGDHLEITRVPDIKLSYAPGDEIVLPTELEVVYNDPECKDLLEVTWDEEDSKVLLSSSETGKYSVKGVIDPGDIVCAENIPVNDDGMIEITAEVDVSNANQLLNPSFEEEDRSMWTITAISGEDPTDYQNKSADAYSGDYSLHFWSEGDMEFSAEQAVTVDKDGNYIVSAFMQGGDFNADAEVYLYAKVGDKEYKSDPVKPDGWVNWKNPVIEGVEAKAGDTITVGMYVKCEALAWATIDDMSLNLQ